MRFSFHVQAGRLFAAGLCLMLVAASGCGGGSGQKTGTVSGTVAVDGTPLGVGFVNFEDSARGFGASAAVTAGAYKFDTPLNTGDYKVSVQPPSFFPTAAPAAGPPRDAIPDRYQQSASTPLTAAVADGPNRFDFKLEK